MTIEELMAGFTPSPSYEGIERADDLVLALNLAATPATDPNGYIVAQQGITEHTGSLEPQTQDSQYIRTGQVTTKTGTTRSFSISGDRFNGDPFQDAILDHAMKYGTGAKVIKEYAYFSLLTGKGETGKVTIQVEDDLSGAAGETASFSVSLTSTEEPKEYVYAPATP